MVRLTRWTALLPAVLVLSVAGCGGSHGARTAGTPLPPVELKYRLIAQLGPLWYCDPDSYPVGRQVTPAYISTRLSEIAAVDPQIYQAILAHYHLTPPLTQQQEQQVYSDYKVLVAFQLVRDGDRYDFAYPVKKGSGWESTLVRGTIDKTGSIVIQSKTAYSRPCPICLAAWTTIDTPNGPILITKLQPGMPVWTADQHGQRQAAVVLQVGSMVAPAGHEVIHLVQADGREVWASPGHPVPDGRHMADLVPGDVLGGSRVLRADPVPYVGRTYDLLPSGPTGVYFANGVPLVSTLANPQTKMSSGRTADTTKLGTSTTSLILRSTATEQIA